MLVAHYSYKSADIKALKRSDLSLNNRSGSSVDRIDTIANRFHLLYLSRQKSSKDDELITTTTKFASKPGLFVFIELLGDYNFSLLLSFVLFIYI